jgi:hypothetical protein
MDGYDINIDHISRQNCGVMLASLSNKDLCTPNQQDTALPVLWTHVVIATTSTTIVVILLRRYNVIDVFARKGKNNTVGKLSVWHDVLISDSGLQTHSVSFSHHSLNMRDREHGEPDGELGRLATPFPAPSAIVYSTHKLCSSIV